MLFRNRIRPCKIDIVNRGELGGGNFGVKPGVIVPDMTDTNDAHAKLLHPATLFLNHS